MIARRDMLVGMALATASGQLVWARTGQRDPMRLTRVYTGNDGRSHFDDIVLPQHEVRAGVAETDWFTAARASLRFIETSDDFKAQPRHCAPRRHVAVIIN